MYRMYDKLKKLIQSVLKMAWLDKGARLTFV